MINQIINRKFGHFAVNGVRLAHHHDNWSATLRSYAIREFRSYLNGSLFLCNELMKEDLW